MKYGLSRTAEERGQRDNVCVCVFPFDCSPKTEAYLSAFLVS